MAQIELVIFDFDGTLVDTAPDLIRAANLFLTQQGHQALPEQRIREAIGMGLNQLLLDVYGKAMTQANERERIYSEFIRIYEREFLTSPTLGPGAIEFLSAWQGQVAIVSNKHTRFIKPILEKLNLHTTPWSAIIGGDTFANMKPHPEPFLAAMRAAGRRPEETVIVGDGTPDIEGALAAGSYSIAVEFGYTSPELLEKLGARATIETFEDLPRVIEILR